MTALKGCQEREVLASELKNGGEDSSSKRILVIPETVEGKDTSDGKTEWDEDFMKKYEEEAAKATLI